MMKKINAFFLFLFVVSSMRLFAQTTIYTNDMDYVLGDVKQAFIQDKISTSEQVENLLIGFKKMQVNGIRIPIFPTGAEPNEQALKYFYRRAVEEGFLVFANPAQDSGGRRIANGSLLSADQEPVKDDAEKRQVLIDRILEIDEEYPDLKWINPFNEDARTGSIWSANDMNVIYSTLHENLKNAELIGSCAWGIPASIDILQNTDIEDYITVSTTHNLGFNHSSWSTFIELSKAAGLPVWDSEVNHNKKYDDKSTRLEAAIAYGVDGLVLYDSYSAIDLNTGEISSSAETWMDLYLKSSTALERDPQTEVLVDICASNQGFRLVFQDSGQAYTVRVVNISGQVIGNYHVVDNELNVEGLQQGIYLLAIAWDDQVQVEKVVVK